MATLILQDTHSELEAEIKSIDKLRTATALKIEEAASHGDLKENYEYKAAKEQMEFVINKRQLLQSHAPFKLIEFAEIDTDQVGFGNKVTIKEEGKKDTEDYFILGPIEFELDLYPMITTYHSPFSKAMIGKKVNDFFMLEIRGEETKFTIMAIEKISVDQKITQ